MKIVFYFFYYLIQFSWGILQNILGFLFFISQKKTKILFFNGAFVGLHNKNWGGISLGIFIIMSGSRDEKWIKNTMIHEYGHTIQSLILGPLYLFLIGIPSLIWCNSTRYIKYRKSKNVSYFDFYPEKSANLLGEKVSKLKILD